MAKTNQILSESIQIKSVNLIFYQARLISKFIRRIPITPFYIAHFLEYLNTGKV